MKPEDQQIAIAKACGIVSENHPVTGDLNGNSYTIWKKNGAEVRLCEIDYLNSLDAMHRAFKSIHDDLRQKYWWELCKVVGTDSYEPQIEPWKVFDATAAQRAEAFLKTLGLWDESSAKGESPTEPLPE